MSGGAWSEWAVFRRRGKMEFVRRGRGVNGSVTRRGRVARQMLTLPNEWALGERVAAVVDGVPEEKSGAEESGAEEAEVEG